MLLSTFLDNTTIKKEFTKTGIYIVSVNIPQYKNLYKVGMADVGCLATRLGNFQTFFFPIRDKVVVHLLANKPFGRRVKKVKKRKVPRAEPEQEQEEQDKVVDSELNEAEDSTSLTISSTRRAETVLHTTIENAGWTHDGTGEWYSRPRGQSVDDLIQMAFEHHYGNKSKNIKADGGGCKFCIMHPDSSEKIPKPDFDKNDIPDEVELEPVREGTRDIIPTVDINGNLRINYRKLKVIRVDE